MLQLSPTKRPISQLKPVQQSRQQVLRAYCLIYILWPKPFVELMLLPKVGKQEVLLYQKIYLRPFKSNQSSKSLANLKKELLCLAWLKTLIQRKKIFLPENNTWQKTILAASGIQRFHFFGIYEVGCCFLRVFYAYVKKLMWYLSGCRYILYIIYFFLNLLCSEVIQVSVSKFH